MERHTAYRKLHHKRRPIIRKTSPIGVTLISLALVFVLAAFMNASARADEQMPAPPALPGADLPIPELRQPEIQSPTESKPLPLIDSPQSTPERPSGINLSRDPRVQEMNADRISGIRRGNLKSQVPANSIPVYTSFDFLSAYLSNQTYPIIVEGKPWDYGSTNMVQLNSPGGGTSYWDYWSDAEPWNSANHLWYEENGNSLTYASETIKAGNGKKTTAYILFERDGPGVMDKLWFTHDPTRSFLRILTQVNLFWSSDPPEVAEWGSLAKLGNLRIEVDQKVVFDGPIQEWFSGDAQQLPSLVRQIMVWRYGQFGSNGNIIPITYKDHVKVYVYGGSGKPKWFMATGMSFPAGTLVQPYVSPADLSLVEMEKLAQNVLNPEKYIQSLPSRTTYDLTAVPGTPATLSAQGSGTISAIHFRISKQYDPRQLWLRVFYGTEKGIDLPLLGFFGEPGEITLHHSSPIGLIEDGDSYLFYSNMPMPYQNGIVIALDSTGTTTIPVQVEIATSETTTNTRLQTLFDPGRRLEVYGPDYTLDIPGSGKLVGLILVSQNQMYESVPRVIDRKTGEEDSSKKRWPMGYLEGNLTLKDGSGTYRYYSGQEDWAEGGYYFNSGYTTPPGGSNRPFGGILRYSEGKDGYATLFRYYNDLSAFRYKDGLRMSFGHGTWNNNFPVTYGATVLYYIELSGVASKTLPASSYTTISAAPPE